METSAHLNTAFTPRQAMSLSFIGLATLIIVGIVGCLLLVLALLYFVVRLILVTMQACTEMFSHIASTYASSDPLLKFCYLILIAYLLYRVYSKVTKKGAIR